MACLVICLALKTQAREQIRGESMNPDLSMACLGRDGQEESHVKFWGSGEGLG